MASIKNISISPQDNAQPWSVDLLASMLRTTADKLKSESDSTNKRIDIGAMYLCTPLVDEDTYYLSIDYWFSDKSYMRQLQKSIELMDLSKISRDQLPISVIGNGLRCMTLRLQPGEHQWDVIELLYYAAAEVKKLEHVTVLDFIYHSYIDNDAIDHPHIRMYYTEPINDREK